MDLSVENLCGLLIRSRLLPPEKVKSLYGHWAEHAKDRASSASHFLRWLVKERLVTEYQASLLAKGMADDFFLDDYKILERVGRGRMAGVYKAVRPDGQAVAIKVLPPSRAKVPSLLARFQREASLSLKFDHPNVVRSLHVGEAKGLHFLVMEFLEGETAEEALARRKRFTPVESARLLLQVLLGLQHLHENGIVHRDLKPANLMLVPACRGPEGDTTLHSTVKILDIGLARPLLEGLKESDQPPPSELTQEGVLLGTPDYLSPEQARDPRSIDIRSDLYSLGCVLYQFLTGQTPFPDGNFLTQMLRHANEKPRPIRELAPEVPEALQQIANYLLAKQATDRYPTPGRAAEAVQAFLASAAATPATPPKATASQSPAKDASSRAPVMKPPMKKAVGPENSRATPRPTAKTPSPSSASGKPAVPATPQVPKLASGKKPSTPTPRPSSTPVAQAVPIPEIDVEPVEDSPVDVELVAVEDPSPPAELPDVSEPLLAPRSRPRGGRNWMRLSLVAGMVVLVAVAGVVVAMMMMP